jgi:hypothetical protein
VWEHLPQPDSPSQAVPRGVSSDAFGDGAGATEASCETSAQTSLTQRALLAPILPLATSVLRIPSGGWCVCGLVSSVIGRGPVRERCPEAQSRRVEEDLREYKEPRKREKKSRRAKELLKYEGRFVKFTGEHLNPSQMTFKICRPTV